MPRISAPQGKAVNVQENKPFGERLRSRFKPSDFVRVINIDDEPYQWQFMPEDGEQESFTDNGAVRVITGRKSFTADFTGQYPGNEEIWVLDPGETEVIVGSNAYLMIDGLFKRLVSKGVIAKTPDQAPTKARNFNWNDGRVQEEMIDKIFLGIENPRFDNGKSSKK